MDPYVAMIHFFGFNFAPRGWQACSGSLMAISQNTALFSLLGTNYGGDGRSSFGLPDLRGRRPVGVGQGIGLSNYQLGQISGTENVTLLSTQMPAHRHNVVVNANTGSAATPTATSYLSAVATGTNGGNYNTYVRNSEPVTGMAANSLSVTGGSQPVSIMSPYQTGLYCIALQGVFPQRP